MPISPDRYKSRAAHRRHKNRAPSCDFRYAKAPRAGPCGCSAVRATRSPAPTASRRAHRARREPDGFAAGAFRQTASNCSTSGSTSAGSSVRTPFSKLRLRSRGLLRPLRGSVATLLRATRRLRRRAHPSHPSQRPSNWPSRNTPYVHQR